VYWIPGFRYSYPSVPIPSDGAVNVPLEYGLAFNYPWKGTSATVSINGPGVSRTESLNYPENVVFETFLPGQTYNWSVDGESWSFTTSNKIYPLNDRSLDTTMVDMLLPYQINNLQVSNNELAFLRFYIPLSIDSNDRIYLNLVPESVENIDNGIILYQYDYQGWNEKLNENNLGVIDHNLLTPLDTLYNIAEGMPVSIDITNIIYSYDAVIATENNYDKKEKLILSKNKDKVLPILSKNKDKVRPVLSKNKDKVMVNNSIRSMEFSFALGSLNPTDIISFYSKEKLITDGEYILSEGHLSETGGGSGFAPQIAYWPNISFEIEEGGIIQGDVNNDGMNNIFDIIILVDIILDNYNGTPDSQVIWASDLNNDGSIDLLDIVQLVNIILDIL